LANEIAPRVVLEDFPRTLYQAKFFIKNAKDPKNVFVLSCSKDLSQERMLSVPQDSANYLPSSLLSKKIGDYNKNMVELLPFLREQTNCNEICTEEAFNVSFKQMCGFVEPTVVSVRTSGSKEATAAKNNVLAGLVQQGYVSLEVNDLIQLEVQRQTEIGSAIQELLNDGKNVWADPSLIVAILKKIIYSGQDFQDKFLLVGFPDQIEHAELFESNCCTITVIVYTTDAAQPTVEIQGDDLSLKRLDSMFAKQFRLRITHEWNANAFEDMLGKKVQWGIVHGRQFAGADECAKKLAAMVKGKVIDMGKIAEDVKKKLGTEDEPFEGDVPVDKVEEAILEMVSKDRAANEKYMYIFNSWQHATATDFMNAIHGEFGLPNFCIHCTANKDTVDARWKEANDGAEEVPEEAQAEIAESEGKDKQNQEEFKNIFAEANIAAKLHTVDTCTMEAANSALKNIFSAKVLLVNHEKRLDVDTVCSNLAIKYDMLYISVYQLIRQHIQESTAWGKKLVAAKRPKALNDAVRLGEGLDDEYEEAEYSAAHFDMKVVLELLAATMMEKRTNQNFVLLEGLCNQKKLEDDKDKFVTRNMDELFMIEKALGQIAGAINLTYKLDPTEFVCDKFEEFEAPVVEEKKVEPQLDEEGNPIEPPAEQPPAEEEGEEAAKPKFNPADFKWTITNKVSKNMPQVFRDFKGANCVVEEKSSASFADVAAEAISSSLDQFCQRVIADHNSKYIY